MMKNLKKIALGLSLVLTLTGCGNKKEDTNSNSSASNQAKSEDRFADAKEIKIGVCGEKNEVLEPTKWSVKFWRYWYKFLPTQKILGRL